MTGNRPGSRTTGMRSRNATTSRTRQGVASRDLKEARRRKRQKQVMRNRMIFGACCLVVLALIIFGITKLIGSLMGSSSKAETSTITFQNDGKVVLEEVMDFDTDTYSESELKDYIKNSISSFNETYGQEAIELNKVSVSDNIAYVKTTYNSVDAYSASSSYQTYCDTYENAVSAGYDFSKTFAAVTDGVKGEAQTLDTDTTFAGQNVIVVNENITVVVPGNINYVSDGSTEVVSNNTIKISPADGNEDSTETVYIIYKAE